jgi:aspartate/glutamate racemase
MKVNGKKTFKMEKELYLGSLETKNMKEISYKAEEQEKVSMIVQKYIMKVILLMESFKDKAANLLKKRIKHTTVNSKITNLSKVL